MQTGLMEWKGFKLPEVPDAYTWYDRGNGNLELRVKGIEDDHMLWAIEEGLSVSIAPLGTYQATWRYLGDDFEEGLHIAVTRVLLGEWE